MSNNNFSKTLKKILTINLIFVFSFTNFFVVFAQTNNGATNSKAAANALCQKYRGISDVFPEPGFGGGSSVPVDLSQLREVLVTINKNAGLTGSELRKQNVINFCYNSDFLGDAIDQITKAAAKEIKTVADECQANIKCLLKRIEEQKLNQKIEKRSQEGEVGVEVAKLLASVYKKKDEPKKEDLMTEDDMKKCSDEAKSGSLSFQCFTTASYWSMENRIIDKYNIDQSEIGFELAATIDEYKLNGITGTRTCSKTKSGAAPTSVKWSDNDCIEYDKSSPLVSQEALKQIVALPYNQALSPAGIFGLDQSLDNINTRTRQGNLIDPDIGSNFGSATGKNNGTGVGNTSPGGPTIAAGNLKDTEPAYLKLLSNLNVIDKLYSAASAAYGSSTAICAKLPVTTRAAQINSIKTTQTAYNAYRDDLIKRWNKASSTPMENHNDLLVQITFDLKDKVNQELINKVLEAVKKMIQNCVDAK